MRRLSEPAVLLTGFDPFAGATRNPSWLVAQALHGRRVAGHRVVAARLPTVFGESLAQLRLLLEAHAPRLVLCVGVASGRRAISIERVAINLDDASLADNQGACPVDTPVVPGGPVAYFSSVPVKAMHAALQKKGVPAELSQTAGTFVCNHVFYGLMHTLATDPARAGVRGGFVHVPELEVVPLADLLGGMQLLLETAIRVRADLKLSGGAVF